MKIFCIEVALFEEPTYKLCEYRICSNREVGFKSGAAKILGDYDQLNMAVTAKWSEAVDAGL